MTSRPTVAMQASLTEQITPVVQRIAGAYESLGPSVAGYATAHRRAFADTQAAIERTQGKLQGIHAEMERLAVQGRRISIMDPKGAEQLVAAHQRLAAQTAPLNQRLEDLHLRLARVNEDAASSAARLPGVASALDKVGASAERAARAANSGGGGGGGGGLGNLLGGAAQLATGYLAVQVVGAVARAATDAGGAVLASAAQMETYRQAFTTLTGSVGAAKAELAEIQTIANKSPFELPALASFAQKLINARVPLQTVNQLLKDTSNLVAAQGGGNAELAGVGLALSQVQAKGRLAGQELNQLAERGINATALLADHFHKSTDEILKMAEAGKITGADLFAALHEAANTPAMIQAAEAQSHTWTGLLSTAHDLAGQLGATFATPLLDVFKSRVDGLITALSDPSVGVVLADWGDKLGRGAQAAFTLWDTISRGAQQALAFVRPVTDLIGQFLGSLPAVADSNPMAPIAQSMTATAEAALALAQAAPAATLKETIQALHDQSSGLQTQAQDIRATAEAGLAPEREKLRVLQAQWTQQQASLELSRIEKNIAHDTGLAKNVFSSTGRAAAARLEGEEQQKADKLAQIGHEQVKSGIEGRVRAIERQRDGQLAAITAQEQGIARTIRALEAQDAAATKAAARDARIAQAQAALDGARAADLARNEASAQAARDRDYQQLQTLDYGYAQNGISVTGFFATLQTAFDTIAIPMAAFKDFWETQLPTVFSDAGRDLGRLADAMGGDKGVRGAIALTTSALRFHFDALAIGLPVAASLVGTYANQVVKTMTGVIMSLKIAAELGGGALGGNIDLKKVEKDLDELGKHAQGQVDDLFAGGEDVTRRTQEALKRLDEANSANLQDTARTFGDIYNTPATDQHGAPVRDPRQDAPPGAPSGGGGKGLYAPRQGAGQGSTIVINLDGLRTVIHNVMLEPGMMKEFNLSLARSLTG